MKIKELEAITGIPRATIRFYEKEGLLSPEREDNGYREYSEEDKDKLMKIKLLRLLSIPVESVRELEAGKLDLTAYMETHVHDLQLTENDIRNAERVCREICTDRAAFATLDAARYISSFEEGTRNELWDSEQQLYRTDTVPRVTAPWRRFFARMLDLSLCSRLLGSCLVIFRNVNIGRLGPGESILCMFAATFIMLMAEPLFLHLFGTTPGKWILGLSVSDENGHRLSYSEAWQRTLWVCAYGMGLSIPIIGVIRLIISRKACLRGEPLVWEEYSVLELKDERSWRIFAYAGLDLLITVAGLLVIIRFGEMPRHRGDITVAEFSENYNRLSTFKQLDFGAVLDEEGKWVERPEDPNSVTIFFPEQYLPEYEYDVQDGKLKSIRFHYETDADYPSDCQAHMQLALRSFAFTDRDLNVINNAGKIMEETVAANAFQPFHYSSGGVTVDCQVNYEGYTPFYSPSYPLIPDENAAERHFSMIFSVAKD